jgi:protein TonB
MRVNYLQRCRGLIERHKEYPVMARKGRTEGIVIIRGTLARNGSLRECIVNRSSGSSLLDNAAVRAVRSVGQFPPVPPELHGGELVFELPVSFRLSAE